MWLLGSLWAAPGSLIGLFLGLASRARPRRDEGTLVFESERGFAAFLGRRGYRAITFGQVVVVRGRLDPRLRAHERAHVRQWMVGGVVFAVLYLLEGLRCLVLGRSPYRDNVFERRARLAETADPAG